jgi:putative glutathione S-transferase
MEKPEIKSYQHKISKDHDTFQPESGRYHLYVGLFCPFAQRALLALTIKGLEAHVGISVCHGVMLPTKPGVDDHTGYFFKDELDPPISRADGVGSYSCSGCTLDPVNGAKTVRELYDLSGENYKGRFSVPVLWDKKTNRIVNNESAEILRIFNDSFNDFAKHPEIDLYPEELRKEIDEATAFVEGSLMANCYGAGFAKEQKQYEVAFHKVFESLDKLEELLKTQRFVAGNQITESDLKLFVILIRFEEAMCVLFKLHKKKLVQYENILNYCRDFYQIEGVASTVNLDHIRICYAANFKDLNPLGIVPVSSGFGEELKKPHNRK